MIRFAVKIAYDGSKFFGSQSQSSRLTVEDILNEAFNRINIRSSSVVLAGRTDRGVHATGSIFHIDVPDFWTPEKLKYAISRGLPNSLIIKTIFPVDNKFHARFSAKRRVYRYIISSEDYRNPFQENYISFIKNGLDINKIAKAIKIFEGQHDFKAFMKSGAIIENSVRTIFKTRVYKHKKLVVFLFEGNGFLRTQIRLMVNFLLKIGYNELDIEQLKKQLFTGEPIFREPAQPNGLYLAKIIY